MRIFEKLTHQTKTYDPNKLLYGFISTHNDSTINTSENVYILEPLTKKERNSYLKSKYNVFLDAENCQLDTYIKFKNSNIQFFRVPSLNNKILPHIQTIDDAVYFNVDEMIVSPFSLKHKYHSNSTIDINAIRHIEHHLNQNLKNTIDRVKSNY